jgi:hypothetical protein
MIGITRIGEIKWYRGNKMGLEGWVQPLVRRVSNDRYHCDQGEKREPIV